MRNAALTLAAVALIASTGLAATDLATLDVPLTLTEVAGVARAAEPCSTGVPLPAGLVTEPAGIAVFDPAGQAVPAQFKVLERWREFGGPQSQRIAIGGPGQDGTSIQWLLVTFLADVPAGGSATYHLKAGTNPAPAAPARPVEGLGPFQLMLTDAEGKTFTDADVKGVKREVIEAGPLRAGVRLESPTSHETFGYMAWVYSYAGSDRADAIVVLKNTPNALLGPFYFRDFSVAVAPPAFKEADRFMLGGAPAAAVSGKLSPGQSACLYQAGDGTDRWDKQGSRDYYASVIMDWSADKHFAKAGAPEFRGYRVTAGGKQLAEGDCALGWSAISAGEKVAVLAIRHFRGNYPSAVEASPGRLTARLLPRNYRNYDGLHWLDDSQRKRWDVSFRTAGGKFAPPDGDAVALAFDAPLVAHCGVEWYRATGMFGLLTGAAPTKPAAQTWPINFGCQAGWVVFGGDTSDRIRRRYHEYPMTGFIRTADPWRAYRTMIGAYHSSGMTPLWLDDYRFPRDKDVLTVRQYCSTARGVGKYREGTAHHGYKTWNMAHFCCTELFDAYRLFGDPLALDAVHDVAAYCQAYADYRAGGGGTIAGTRSDGHPLTILAEACRITARADYLDSLKVLADASWRQVNKDRGNYGVMDSWEGGQDKCEKPFMMCQVINGLIDYWDLTGDERTADQILGMLDFIIDEASLGEWGFSYVVKLDPGLQEPYRRELIAKMSQEGKNTSYSHLAPTIAWGHRYSGEPHYRACIDGINAKAYPHQSRAYVNYYPERADRQPPAAVADLKAEPLGGGKVRLTWTTPPDAARLQVKFADRPMIERCWPDKVETNSNWWSATHAQGEPAPQPGKTQGMVVENVPVSERCFAIRSFDAAQNRSPISNIVKVEVK